MGLKERHHTMVTMNHLPAEIVELVIEFACCTIPVLVKDGPVESLAYSWERELIFVKDEKTGRKRGVLSRYKWVPYWDEYCRVRHLNPHDPEHDGFGIGPDPVIIH
jgi:hypothetical protein